MKFSRYSMYKSIEKTLKENGLFPMQGKILGISGIDSFKDFIDKNNAAITETSWPKTSMLDLPFPDESFDVVISNQVIEHIKGNPQKAIDESRRILKDGGIAIHTTVFMYRIHHKHPGDYWRFSTYGLKYLCRNFSEIIACDGWGSRFSQILFTAFPRATTWRVPKRKLSILRWLANKNAPNFYSQVWIIAKK